MHFRKPYIYIKISIYVQRQLIRAIYYMQNGQKIMQLVKKKL